MLLICHFGSGSERDKSEDRMSSSGLMSCVRESSPSLDLDANESGALSLPETTLPAVTTMSLAPASPGAMSANYETIASTAEQQKRRRFHPLRNLRRIFRRRTITSVNDSPTAAAAACSNSSEKPTSTSLTASTYIVGAANASETHTSTNASSIASPPALTLSLPKSKAAADALAAERQLLLLTTDATTHQQQQQQQQQQLEQQLNMSQLENLADVMYLCGTREAAFSSHQHSCQMTSALPSTAFRTVLNSEIPPTNTLPGHRSSVMSGGTAVLPDALNTALSRSFYAERQKLKNSLGESSQELDSSANSSLGSDTHRIICGHERRRNIVVGLNGSGSEMTDSQRSFSEGRLVDSDYARDGLSQSHDSVFSGSATASSLSIVLKAELADALRKRRNRPDTSDEDLGLPRSPVSPQQCSTENSTVACTSTPTTTAGNRSTELSSQSALSMNSSNDSDFLYSDVSALNVTLPRERNCMTATGNRYSRISIGSTRTTETSSFACESGAAKSDAFGEVDLFSTDWQRLSHSAAKHKMAVRPVKKKGPSRQHRRTLETSIPEGKEDLFKLGGNHLLELTDNALKTKARHSMPTNVDLNNMPQSHEVETSASTKYAKDIIADKCNIKVISSGENNLCESKYRESSTAFAAADNVLNSVLLSSPLSVTDTFKINIPPEASNNDERNKNDMEPVRELSQAMETNESTLLRRLMQRNSKRSISRLSNGDDGFDTQNEAKKLQISNSAYETRDFNKSAPTTLEKSMSAIGYQQQVEQMRKDIKREIISEGTIGLNAMLGAQPMPADGSRTTSWLRSAPNSRDTRDAAGGSLVKPKSGPAARQRYLPQELSSSSNSSSSPYAMPFSREYCGNMVPQTNSVETFQSTSIIQDITAQSSITAAATKTEHHFEKKPKIFGLSSFQQKISRSSDVVARANTSIDALNMGVEKNFLDCDQRQLKFVEKSRSFRTYNEGKECGATQNNTPSLPDLSLQLPRFNEFILTDKEYSSPSPPEKNGQSTSLGFEINDNNLVRVSVPKAESLSSMNAARNTAMNSSKSTTNTAKLLTPTVAAGTTTTTLLRSVSPTNSIAEIEQTIDMIVKSPFVSILRKSANVGDETAINTASNMTGSSVDTTVPKTCTTSNNSPQLIFNAEEMQENETRTNTKAAAVTATTKSKETTKPINLNSAAMVANINTRLISFNRAQRSASVVESIADESPETAVPEFLKIQLNRVDPGARAPKSTTTVLAKNIRERTTSAKTTTEEYDIRRTDNLNIRSYSNESVEIKEHVEVVDTDNDADEQSIYRRESKNGPTKSCSMSSIDCTANDEAATTAKRALKKNTSPRPLLNPNTQLKESNVPASNISNTKTPASADYVMLRQKTADFGSNTDGPTCNKFSLQERKRLFMNDDRAKTDIKLDELRNERKKSISEELQRKSCSINAAIETKRNGDIEIFDREIVTLRKKPFGAVMQHQSYNGQQSNNTSSNKTGNGSKTSSSSKGNTNSNSNSNSNCKNNNNSSNNSNSNCKSNNNSSNNSSNGNAAVNKDDSTPELMKVFARRSLKIKDEDLAQLADKILLPTASTATLNRKLSSHASAPSNVDSDKENQSASEEKLDKLSTKFEVIVEQTNNNKVIISNASNSLSPSSVANAHRNSLIDYRNSIISGHKNAAINLSIGTALGKSIQNSNSNSNNNNMNGNHIHNNNATMATTLPKKGYASANARCCNGGFRANSMNESRHGSGEKKWTKLNGNSDEMENNNNNSNNNNNHNQLNGSKSGLERQSLCSRTTNGTTVNALNNSSVKTIERSATVGEFKGIHQRRAEWEQRAKEAFK